MAPRGGGKTGRKELLPQLRARICTLHEIGLSYTSIHKMHPEVPISTIKTTVNRERARVNHVSQPRRGRRPILSEAQRETVYDLATNQNPNISNADLLASVDNAVGLRSLQLLLRAMKKKKNKKKGVKPGEPEPESEPEPEPHQVEAAQ